MEIQLINEKLLASLHEEARSSERLRQHFDMRTTSDDTSQRMLNALEPGTHVSIHRHANTSESVVCIEGCLDWVFYEEIPTRDTGEPVHDRETVTDEMQFKEIARFRLCPRERMYGIQVPKMVWHSIEVYEPSTIFESMDGKYGD